MNLDDNEKCVELLQQAIAFSNAQKGLLQVYDRETEVLKVVAHVGFGKDFLALFGTVRAFDPSACGRALGLKSPILISDVTQERAFIPFMQVIAFEGFRSVKAMPFFFDDGSIAGVLSVHFMETRYEPVEQRLIPDAHFDKIKDLYQRYTFSQLTVPHTDY